MSKSTVSEVQMHPHRLLICDRKQAEITGVTEIFAFDETQAHLKTDCGKMRITGKNLRVTSLLPEENKALIQGEIAGITYSSPVTPSSFGKIFRK